MSDKAKLGNQSMVYNVMRTMGKPATITEIAKHVGGISERTVRRSISNLITSGHVISTGKSGLSNRYALRDHVPQAKIERSMIPFGDGDMLPVADFISLMVSPGTDPMHAGFTRRKLISESMSDGIRQRMAFVVMSSGEPGYADAVSKYQRGLISIQQELEFALRVVSRFVNSAVWYDHYRDNIATSLREMQRDDPELFQMARDYIVNLTNKEG